MIWYEELSCDNKNPCLRDHNPPQPKKFNIFVCYSVPYEELRQRYLQFSVYDFDRFSRHDLIGHVVLKGLLESADLQQEIEYTMNILAPPQVISS